jgi:predicted DNA-binding transcriptional regulator YafY
MNIIERRLEIIRILHVKRSSSIPELAERLSVSSRTVQRDIQAIIAVVPLVCISGNGGGIRMLDGYHPYKDILTKKQVDVIQKMMQFANEEEKEILTDLLHEYASRYYPESKT